MGDDYMWFEMGVLKEPESKKVEELIGEESETRDTSTGYFSWRRRGIPWLSGSERSE